MLVENARAQDPNRTGPRPIASVRLQRGCGETTFRLLLRAAALKPRPDPRDSRIAELEAMIARMRPIVAAVHAWSQVERGSEAEGNAEGALIEGYGQHFTADMLEGA